MANLQSFRFGVMTPGCSRVGACAAANKSCLKRVIWTKAGAGESAGQGIPACPTKVRPKKPVRPAGVAAGRQDVVPEGAIADRHFGPGVEIGASPWDDDDPAVTVAVRDDCRGRLDDGAAGGALDDRPRRRLLFGGCGRHGTDGTHRDHHAAEDGAGEWSHDWI